MDNAFRIFLEAVIKSFPRSLLPVPPASKSSAPQTPPPLSELPGPKVAVHNMHNRENSHRHMSDSEFMEYLRTEAERLNEAFREAALRDIDPHASIEAVTEADEFDDIHRMAIVRLEPMKLLPTEDSADGELEL